MLEEDEDLLLGDPVDFSLCGETTKLPFTAPESWVQNEGPQSLEGRQVSRVLL